MSDLIICANDPKENKELKLRVYSSSFTLSSHKITEQQPLHFHCLHFNHAEKLCTAYLFLNSQFNFKSLRMGLSPNKACIYKPDLPQNTNRKNMSSLMRKKIWKNSSLINKFHKMFKESVISITTQHNQLKKKYYKRYGNKNNK